MQGPTAPRPASHHMHPLHRNSHHPGRSPHHGSDIHPSSSPAQSTTRHTIRSPILRVTRPGARGAGDVTQNAPAGCSRQGWLVHA